MYFGMLKNTSKQCQTVKIKPVALSIIELHLSEGISQLLSQSVAQSLCLRTAKNSISRHFRLIRKLIWAQFHLINTTPSLSVKIEVSFWVIVLCGSCLLLDHPYYEPRLWFMIRLVHQKVVGTPYICAFYTVHIKTTTM